MWQWHLLNTNIAPKPKIRQSSRGLHTFFSCKEASGVSSTTRTPHLILLLLPGWQELKSSKIA